MFKWSRTSFSSFVKKTDCWYWTFETIDVFASSQEICEFAIDDLSRVILNWLKLFQNFNFRFSTFNNFSMLNQAFKILKWKFRRFSIVNSKMNINELFLASLTKQKIIKSTSVIVFSRSNKKNSCCNSWRSFFFRWWNFSHSRNKIDIIKNVFSHSLIL